MKQIRLSIVLSLAIFLMCSNQKPQSQNWTHFARIAGHGVSLDRIENIIKSATETHVFGIEIDNSLTGYYESFLNPEEKLKAITAFAERAHKIGNYAFIYTEGLETITSNADQKEHTFFKDHPDWVQRDITGRPAIFGGDAAFWISEGDEDVWISPYATEWRKIYLERIRQLAATGIDGVYIDIPYWMTHFRGWEDTWASFDEYTVAAFKEKTGLNAKTDIKIGDFNDPNFIKWIDFRIQTLTEFMKEVDENVKAVNPKCMTIAEIYPGIEEAAVRVGADVYDMYEVVDVIAHEYGGGGGNAARKNPLDWFSYMTGMYTFRAFAGDKASWMLSYSWDGEERIDPREAMKNLAVAQLMAGTNTWDARGHVMSGSNDMETRKVIFKWIADHEKTFYLPRNPINPIGVYFSPKTRNYFPDDFIASYKGMMYLLLQSHLEFQIVTPRNLNNFRGQMLILPDVKCLSKEEVDFLKSFIASGNSLLVTAETGKYNEKREVQIENAIHKLLNITDTSQKIISTSNKKFIYYPNCPGKIYFEEARKQFNNYAIQGSYKDARFNNLLQDFSNDIIAVLKYKPTVAIEASPFISTQIALVDDKIHVFMANFKGLKGRENAEQIPEKDVKITFPAKQKARVYMLPFLGEVQELKGEWSNGKLTCVIPEIKKGMVVWCE